MARQNVAQTETPQITADKMVETVYGWLKKGARSKRIHAYLDAKDWTAPMVRSACGEVEKAVRAETATLDEQAQQVKSLQRIEHDSYQTALERQKVLLTIGQELVEMAQTAIVFFRPQQEEEKKPVEEPTVSLRDWAVEFFKKPTPKPLSPIDKLPVIAEVQLPPADNVYQEIAAIFDTDDPAVEEAREWDTIRQIAEEEGTGPEQELANVGRTYAELLPFWERAQLMGHHQVQQSQGIITALAAHWSRIQETVNRQQAAIGQRRAQLSAYQEACTKVREALQPLS